MSEIDYDRTRDKDWWIVEYQRRITELTAQLNQIDKYFTSTNHIPVERATILSKDYWKIRGKG